MCDVLWVTLTLVARILLASIENIVATVQVRACTNRALYHTKGTFIYGYCHIV